MSEHTHNWSHTELPDHMDAGNGVMLVWRCSNCGQERRKFLPYDNCRIPIARVPNENKRRRVKD